MSKRAALNVGINVFKNYPSATLQGCVNDANEMAAVLQKCLGFEPRDITVLKDSEATKTNIMGKLKDMADGARAGRYNHLVFSLSSHGTQVPDLSGEEPDRADEAFCPHDLAQNASGWDPRHIIVDDELRDLFVQLPPNVLLEVYLDTCHSGDGLRGVDLLLDRRPRYLPPPTVDAFLKVQSKRYRGLSRAILEASKEKGLPHQILWAACRADQTSADAHIAGNWHGAFTYFFCKEMYACKNALSRAKVLAKVRADLAAGHYSQIPQLECPAITKSLEPGVMKAA